MRCPFCHFDNDKVLDTRANSDGYSIKRRRYCNSCHRKFPTLERIERTSIRIIKRDESREPFSPDKLASGIERACWKRKVSSDRIQSLVQTIETELYERYEDEVPSREIGEMVMEQLAEIDQVAYIRFASVYRDFTTVQDFIREIGPYLPAART
jgi:transcriptional repressor NrdR